MESKYHNYAWGIYGSNNSMVYQMASKETHLPAQLKQASKGHSFKGLGLLQEALKNQEQIKKFMIEKYQALPKPNHEDPFAEFWMGCHQKGESRVVFKIESEISEKHESQLYTIPLSQFLELHKEKPLPFLFKVLSIAQNLSL